MYLKGKLLIVALTLAVVACATESRPFKWRQFKGSIGFEEAERYCKNQDEIYRDKLASSIFDTLILATAPPAGASGYSKGMAERPNVPAGMSMDTCMDKSGWQKIPR
jgi:hypothetical protein